MGSGASAELKRAAANLGDEEIKQIEEKYANLKSQGVDTVGIVQKLLTEDSTATENASDDEGALVRARARVSKLNHEVSMEVFSNYLLGTDGAAPSDLALEVCLKELMTSNDTINILHASDPKRTDLPPNLKPDAIKERMDIRLMSEISQSRYKLTWVEQNENEKIKSCILRTVNQMTSSRSELPLTEKPSYFVTGVTGRRGTNLVGKLVLLAVGHFHIPNIVIKKPPVTDRPRVFVASIKHLSRLQPLHIALDLMKPGKGDKLIVLHIYTETFYNKTGFESDESSHVIANFQKLFQNLISQQDGMDNSGSKFIAMEDTGAKNWRDIVLETCENEKADYVIMNPAIHMGDVLQDNATMNNCKHIIENVECNVVVCNH
mmetsp:Transcript_22925/g.29896  ORF Transcript_22925/g.29896 Transcript_22925/m.29896 type:complete len:377 (+) Transcript_22925:22-1152(+)